MNIKAKIKLLVLGGLLIGAANQQAAGKPNLEPADTLKTEAAVAVSEAAVTKEDLEGVRAEVASLNDQLNRKINLNIANTQRALQIGGNFQNRFNSVTYTNNTTVSPYTNSFVFNSVLLSLRGSLRADYDEGRNLDYVVSFQLANPAYSFQAADVYLQYSILQSLDIEKPFLFVQFGQQKKPFGLEPQVQEGFTPVINIATFAGALGLASREIGLQLRGDLFPTVDLGYNFRNPVIQYAVGIFNGSGPNALDNNQNKDIAGRIVLNAPVDYNSIIRGLTLGGSIYTGKQDISKTFGTGASAVTLKDKSAKVRYGVDLSYVPVRNPIGFTAEYAWGKDDAIIGTTAANAVKETAKSQGYTITVFYSFGEQFLKNEINQSRRDDWWPITYQPFVRFDYWDPNTAVSGNHTTITTYGFNLFFAQTTKLQLNYVVTDKKSTKLKQDDVILQFQYGF
ncbi:MAG: hypothetical protein HGB19_00185 [Chlorobiales bacterium]|nr:hypothetical protein [Chlorobiales bacterium]